MPLPAALRTRPLFPSSSPVPAATSAAFTTALALGGAVPFQLEKQQQTQWCWAAVGVSLKNYYSPTAGLRQCTLANRIKGQTTCCGNGASVACDQPDSLTAVLTATGNLAAGEPASPPTGFGTFQSEMANRRPVAARIEWADQSGHFVVIADAYLDTLGGEWVEVHDPLTGSPPTTYRFDDFRDRYNSGQGRCTHTYRTH